MEIVRRLFDACSRGDFSVGADVLDPDIRVVWLSVIDAGENETRGVEAAVAMLASWMTNWEDPTLTAEWIVDAGDDVAVVAVWRARGEGCGVASEWRHGAVWTFREAR